jgi:transglutaminase-like putative cysteine protease
VLPFTQDPPAVAWRNRTRAHARTTISPLVDIRSRLVARSDVVAFTVETPLRAYWRITSLDVFDGDIWSSHGSYQDVDAGEPLKGRAGEVATQRFSVGNLRSIWLPVAYRPASTPTIDGISFDDDADAFITDEATSDGLVYQVSSAVQTLTPAVLRAARPASVSKQEVAMPTTVDPRVAVLASQLTQGRSSAYDKALAIQQFLRSPPFRYDLSVPAGHDDDSVARFLFVTKRGYCEQFAGTFAVLARLAGLPTRVAVGFTSGERDDATGSWTVRELHAHAWPEVFIGSAGWVAFEPTPGRGIPGAESYTGAVESQADSRRPGAASTLVPTTLRNDPNAPGALQSGTTTTAVVPTTAPAKIESSRSSVWRVVAYIVAALLVFGGIVSIVPLTASARRRRRYAAAATPKAKVLVAWTDTDEALRFAGASVRGSQTPSERVERAGTAIGDGGVATLTRLAELVDVAAYGPDELSVTHAEAAWRDASDVRRRAFATKSRWKFLTFALNPRRLRR